MRTLFIFLLIKSLLLAVSKDEIYSLITKKEFEKACLAGQYIATASTDGKFLIEYGKACMASDMIDQLSIPASKLRGSKESREAAAIFATLQAQKKLLYLSLLDGISLKNIRTPKINHPLSIVFERISTGDFQSKDGILSVKDGQNEYEITALKEENPPKIMIIEKASGKKRIYF